MAENNAMSWRHLVNWQRFWSFGGLLMGLPLAGMSLHHFSTIQAGAAEGSGYNWAVTGGTGLAGLLSLVMSVVFTWRASGKISPMNADRQKALATIAATCLSDPHAMDLVQRLARHLDEQVAPQVESDLRPVPVLLEELEQRLRSEMAATLMGKMEARK